MLENEFKNEFKNIGGHPPFFWQSRLFKDFVRGHIPSSLDLPTGLGKTSVMTIWFLARQAGADLPRRLVYVVDRRAVVDQATTQAEALREKANGRDLKVSTLRGQFVDNREWLADPAAAAIIVGTVDMIGSRLLFSGYGVGPRMRPYHAGFLGADTLVVLDEAHLCRPFEALLEAVACRDQSFGSKHDDDRKTVPAFRLLSLSATGRAKEPRGNEQPFALLPEDTADEVVQERLTAAKSLSIRDEVAERELPKRLAEEAWDLADRHAPARILVYCNSRDGAESVKKELDGRLYGKKGRPAPEDEDGDTQLLVGARRVFERQDLFNWLKSRRWLSRPQKDPHPKDPESTDRPGTRSSFLIATSAGEVGVDIDADHMVSDLVAWERMVQRLGRVNRLGRGEASVTVVPADDKSDKSDARSEKRAAVQTLMARLPQTRDGGVDVSPGAILALKQRAASAPDLQALIDSASSEEPLRPALTRPLVDAWSMTALETHTGRPEIQPWLRGWIEDEEQTEVVWRQFLPVRLGEPWVTDKEINEVFALAPPHTSEVLETETYRVVPWLIARAAAVLEAASPKRRQAAPPPEPGRDNAGGVEEERQPFERIDLEAAAEADLDDAPDAGEAQAEEPEGERPAGADLPPLERNPVVAIILDRKTRKHATWRLKDLARLADKKAEKGLPQEFRKDRLERDLANRVMIIDARLGGLTDAGMLDKLAGAPPRTADDGADWLPDVDGKPVIGFRLSSERAEEAEAVATGAAEQQGARAKEPAADKDWRERYRFPTAITREGEAERWLVIRTWKDESQTDNDRAIGREQLLAEHQRWTEQRARAIAGALNLPPDYAETLAVAAALHDEGKTAWRWQQAVGGTKEKTLAKSARGMNTALLEGYRHEFGSLPRLETDARFAALPGPDLQDLALHLVAAHHGWARPIIPVGGCEDAPPSALAERARAVALRFARLQRRWGPWGLAWWESLLRAADHQASAANNDENQRERMRQHPNRPDRGAG